MTAKPYFISPTDTVKVAANKMLKEDYGFIPIGENDRLVGAITDRDIAIRVVAQGKDPNKTLIKDCMTTRIQYCFEKDPIEKVAKKMEDLKIRRLVVLNDNKRMTGIISLGDIASKCKDAKLCSEVTTAVS